MFASSMCSSVGVLSNRRNLLVLFEQVCSTFEDLDSGNNGGRSPCRLCLEWALCWHDE